MNVKNKFFFILVALIVGLLTINGAFAETALHSFTFPETTNEVYYNIFGGCDALEEIRNSAGTQFDPDIVTSFIKCIRWNKKG